MTVFISTLNKWLLVHKCSFMSIDNDKGGKGGVEDVFEHLEFFQMKSKINYK